MTPTTTLVRKSLTWDCWAQPLPTAPWHLAGRNLSEAEPTFSNARTRWLALRLCRRFP